MYSCVHRRTVNLYKLCIVVSISVHESIYKLLCLCVFVSHLYDLSFYHRWGVLEMS
jgi:hypothetical protein